MCKVLSARQARGGPTVSGTELSQMRHQQTLADDREADTQPPSNFMASMAATKSQDV